MSVTITDDPDVTVLAAEETKLFETLYAPGEIEIKLEQSLDNPGAVALKYKLACARFTFTLVKVATPELAATEEVPAMEEVLSGALATEVEQLASL